MSEKRKEEIVSNLLDIYNNFSPEPEKLIYEPMMFWLISTYNSKYDNPELIGGSWVMENCPEPLKSLP